MKVAQALRWRLDNRKRGIQIFYPVPAQQFTHVIHYVLKGITFKHFLKQFSQDSQSAQFPPGTTENTEVVDFLLDNTQAKAVQFTAHNTKFALKNNASNIENKIIAKNILDPASIYSNLGLFIKNIQGLNEPLVNNYLIKWKLKLQAEAFCRTRGWAFQNKLTDPMKQQLMDYLVVRNQTNARIQAARLQTQIWAQEQEYIKCQKTLKQLEGKVDNVMQWYKRMAAGLTGARLVSFGYMIFFVQWLGWDIIQPLTYSVSVIFSLMAIRFYRKHLVDRNPQTIRQAFMKMITKPDTLHSIQEVKQQMAAIQLKKTRLQREKETLLNQIFFQSTLPDIYQKLIDKDRLSE